MGSTTPAADEAALSRMGRLKPWLVRIVLIVIAVLVTVEVIRLIGRIDFDEVWSAFRHVAWWQIVVLALLVLVRQVCNAAPLSVYVPGVGLYKSTKNDLAASTMAAFAPPPTDMALRVAMFTSWGVETSRALAASTMNTLTFYIVRFGAPVIGFAITLVVGGPLGLRLIDLLSIAIAVAITVGIVLAVRAETWAHRIGLRGGQMARKVSAKVDPEHWAGSTVDFFRTIASGFRSQFPRAIGVTLVMVLVDATVVAMAMRFVGLDTTDVSWWVIYASFFFAYPLTVFPMHGIGLLDSVVMAAVIESAGDSAQEPVLAALLIWRVITIVLPLSLGGLSLFMWRHELAKRKRALAE